MREIGKVVPEGDGFRLELRRRTEQRVAEELGLQFTSQPNPRCRRWSIFILWFPTKAKLESAQRRINRRIVEQLQEKIARRKKRRFNRQSVRREIH